MHFQLSTKYTYCILSSIRKSCMSTDSHCCFFALLSYFVLRNRMSKRRHAVRRSPSVKFQNPLYCTNSFHQHNTMSFFSATYGKSTISNKRIFRCFFVFQIIFYICHTAFFLTSKNLPYFNIIQNFFFPTIFHCI